MWIDSRRILHEADPAAEWRQAYAEAGRLIRAYFWEPDMCGIDWDAVLEQYRPLVERVASPDEFADLLREVLGELGTSHAYVTAARRNEGPAHYQRRQACSAPTSPRAREAGRSGASARRLLRLPRPLPAGRHRHPRGRGPHPRRRPPGGPAHGSLSAARGGGRHHRGADVRPRGGEGPPRRVAVVPLVDETPLRYQDWVAKRRAVVRELSGGRCGYLHIRTWAAPAGPSSTATCAWRCPAPR
ncbi:hypothetical protein GCM10023238_15160 [Streptomyces heliomycini]